MGIYSEQNFIKYYASYSAFSLIQSDAPVITSKQKVILQLIFFCSGRKIMK